MQKLLNHTNCTIKDETSCDCEFWINTVWCLFTIIGFFLWVISSWMSMACIADTSKSWFKANLIIWVLHLPPGILLFTAMYIGSDFGNALEFVCEMALIFSLCYGKLSYDVRLNPARIEMDVA